MPLGSVAATVIIVGAFAVVHSLFVTDAAKRKAVAVFGPRAVQGLYRFGFTCMSVLTATLASVLIAGLPDRTLGVLPWPAKIVFHCLQAVGVLVAVSAFRVMKFLEFVGISQCLAFLRGQAIPGDIEGISQGGLLTRGVYGVMRHPLYGAGILIFTFNVHITTNALTVSLLADIYFLLGSLLEHRRLKRHFGRAYEEYAEDVPAFIPSIRRLVRRPSRR